MTVDEALNAVTEFSKTVVRFTETSDPGMFDHGYSDRPAFSDQHLNIQIMVEGNFGAACDFFEAIRVLGEHQLPKKKGQ
jgi:hypothetical protein